MITRRALLLGAVAAGSTAAACGSDSKARPVVTTVQTGSFISRRRAGAKTGWAILRPRGGGAGTSASGRLPVVIALHGRGGSHADAYRSVRLDLALAAHVTAGGAPFAVASVDGGDHEYWHPRRATDAAGMVIEEFLPLLARHDLATSRIGLIGWSMGGYGALYLAGALGSRRVAAAVAESPALWHESGHNAAVAFADSAAGAFDDAADFDRHSIFGHLSKLSGIALRVDCGASDGFAPVTRDLRAALSPTPAGGIEPGGHDADYWRGQAPAQLRFLARHVT